MKFYKGQKIVCIANSNEFDPVLSDFNRSLQLALGNEVVPQKGKEYIVTNPFVLLYSDKVYININGFGGTPIDESAFRPIKNTCINYEFEKITLIKSN